MSFLNTFGGDMGSGRSGPSSRFVWRRSDTFNVIADNGFLDILLHLGLVGFVVFSSVPATAAVRSWRYALTRFVWFLVVVVLFMTIPQSPLPSRVRAGRPRARGRDAPSGA
jgi:hypothetical protein